MIDKEKIKQGVINMFKVNMGLKSGETVLVVTDVPTMDEWREKTTEQLADFVQRTLLAKAVSQIASERFPDCTVGFFTYPSVGKHGTYPGKEVEERMKAADVVIAITTYSLSHTDARAEACKAGSRIASMPMFLPEMLYPRGPMAADYQKIAEETKKIAELLTDAVEANIRTEAGTDVTFSLKGRSGLVDAGIFIEKGAFGNLPSGEAYIVPLEGTGNGKVVVQTGWYPDLKENLIFTFKNGSVTGISGGGDIGDRFRGLLALEKDEPLQISRRNLAEFGVGTNPYAKRPDNVLEAEKIKGTVHVAIGDSSHIGGKVTSDIHQDFIIPHPKVTLNGKTVMKNGELLT